MAYQGGGAIEQDAFTFPAAEEYDRGWESQAPARAFVESIHHRYRGAACVLATGSVGCWSGALPSQ